MSPALAERLDESQRVAAAYQHVAARRLLAYREAGPRERARCWDAYKLARDQYTAAGARVRRLEAMAGVEHA